MAHRNTAICARVMLLSGLVPSEMPLPTAHCWPFSYQVAPPVGSVPALRARTVHIWARVVELSGKKMFFPVPLSSPRALTKSI